MKKILKIEVSKEFVLLKQKLTLIKQGENILLKTDGVYSLMKYEYHDFEVEDWDSHRCNRDMVVNALNFLFTDTKEEQQKLLKKRIREWKRYKCNVYGTHRLDFSFDKEFEIFLPSSVDIDMFLTLGRETIDGEIISREDNVEIVVGDDLIALTLQNVVRPQYFKNVVVPFLEGRCTKFDAPKWSRHWFRRVNKRILLERFEKAVRHLDHGSFVYVGCKEEVYLLGLAREDDGYLYMQGTYLTSTKPMFYFSNNYLGFISKYDAEMPKFNGTGWCNVAKYRTYDIPGFDGKPFIFPQMGRKQNCKNTIFTGEPQVITGCIDEALAHFKTTDFAEFVDVVERYAKRIGIIHSSSEEPNGYFYY